MNLRFKMLYAVNLYYFIENLSSWHKYIRRVYRKRFYRLLNNEQKNLLKQYAKIRKKYSNEIWFDSAWLEKSLKKSLYRIKRRVNKKEFIIISRTFLSLDTLFLKLWNLYVRKDLEKINNKLIKEDHLIKSVIKKIDFILESESKEIIIYICWNPEESGGSKFVDGIIIEGTSRNSITNFTRIIAHEFIHFIDINTKDMEKLFMHNGFSKIQSFFIREAVTDMIAVDIVRDVFGKQPKIGWKEVDSLRIMIIKLWENEKKLGINFWDRFLPCLIRYMKYKKPVITKLLPSSY